VTPLVVGLAAAGALLGFAADRLATRWPEHDEEHPPGRRIDWRTAACVGLGAFAGWLLGDRFGGDPLVLAIFGAWFVTLVVGFATDLDQRILPDELTLPVIPVAAIFAVSGRNPLVGGELLLAVAVAVVVPLVIFIASIPYGEGAFGIGDVKLLAGVGLMTGGLRAFTGLVSGLFAAGLVIALLLVSRRIGRRTYVPFGPFLIFGALWGIFVRT
jgi:leader peptidase (prepilin peptidase)/N-methyltransferase